MNVKVEAYLADQQRQAQDKAQAYRQKVLETAGLAQKVYSPHEQASQEFPHYDEEEMRYYKLVCEEVSDEEFAKIEAYAREETVSAPQAGTMFSNIGNKIQSVAQVFCWIGITLSMIAGIVLLGTDEDLILTGLLVAGVGSLSSWIGSLFLYGFGELIVKVTQIEKNTRK